MVGRFAAMLVGLVGLSWIVCDHAVAQPRPVPGRPGLYEIGEPFSISRQSLSQEMRRNDELRLYITQYGWPDYAEVQEILPQWPWSDYEVRLYYLDQRLALAYGRVFLSDDFPNYGSRRSIQVLTDETRDRLLTARPIAGVGAVAPPPSAQEDFFPPRNPEPSSQQLERNQPLEQPPASTDDSDADLQLETQKQDVSANQVAQQQP